ncbi:MAG: hypothetical protein ACR2GZ_06435 [Solirubrobacteraceae bacterium]
MTEQTATRSPNPQRLRALERANEVRLARASLKRSIALGHLSAAEVLLTCPREAASWPIGELLMSQRRWGTTRCRKFLARNQIVETKPIGTLTDRQRRILAAALQASCDRAVERLEVPGVGEMALAVA